MILLHILYNICAFIVFKHHVDGLYNDFYISILYKLIYIYSAFQIKVNKYMKLMPTLDILKTFQENNSKKYIYLYEDGLCCFKQRLHPGATIFHKQYYFISYDFLVFTDIIEHQQIFKIYKFEESYKTIDFEYELSSIKFIALILNFNNNKYNMELHTPYINYYIVDNIIDKDFILYYYRTFIDKEYCDYKNFEYSLYLCDQNADIFDLNTYDKIIILKDSYNIIRLEEFSESDESITENSKYYDDTIKIE